jgi:hypothetical protein
MCLIAGRLVFPVVEMNRVIYAQFCKRITALYRVAGCVQEKNRAGPSYLPWLTNLNQYGILCPGHRACLIRLGIDELSLIRDL